MEEEQKAECPDTEVEDEAAAAKKIRDMANMALELKHLVEYTKKSCGNVDHIVTAKMRKLGIKICYDVEGGVIKNEVLNNLIDEGETVYYIDGDIAYYIPLVSLQ